MADNIVLCKCLYVNVTWLSCLNCYMVDDIVERKCLCKCYMAELSELSELLHG
jgi:hypothetical protein